MMINLLQKEMLKRKNVCFFLAASVASQWLDFLHQDLSGRLAGVCVCFTQRGFSGSLSF